MEFCCKTETVYCTVISLNYDGKEEHITLVHQKQTYPELLTAIQFDTTWNGYVMVPAMN